jgi:imidazolonepropionase-like amidohydrolase
MRPAAALLAATRNAADVLGMSAEIGAVTAGRMADIVAVQGNPLTDIGLLQNIGFVMKNGVVYKRDGAAAW